MTCRSSIYHLPGLVLPETAGTKRRLPFLSPFRTSDPLLRDSYDRHTLIYGAVYSAQQRLLRLTAPRLFNLHRTARKATYVADGITLPPPRIRDFKRYSTLEFDLMQGCETLQVSLGNWSDELPVAIANNEQFEGLNVLYTMSRNNDLDWICDWVRYHHNAHGANALLLVDNDSDAYSINELASAVQELGILKAFSIISAPFRYGPSSKVCRRASNTRFLQPALINLSRDMLLQNARAVLVCDIDELVISRTKESIFDFCATNPLGYVRFRGYWRFPDVTTTTRSRHSDHVWLSVDESAACPTKYAVVPHGPLGGGSWMVHNLEGHKAEHHITDDFWFVHCRDISTNWKLVRTGSGAMNRTFDTDLIAHFSDNFL